MQSESSEESKKNETYGYHFRSGSETKGKLLNQCLSFPLVTVINEITESITANVDTLKSHFL